MHPRSIAAFLALILLAAACDGSGSPPQDAKSRSESTAKTTDFDYGTVERVKPETPVGADPSGAKWFLRADPLGDGTRLQVVFLKHRGCEHYQGTDIVETAAEIQLMVRTWFDVANDCFEDPVWVRVVVGLTQPLGDREVVSLPNPLRPDVYEAEPAREPLANVHPVPAFEAIATPDDRQLVLTWWADGCAVSWLDRVEVDEMSGSVRPTVFVGDADHTVDCQPGPVQWRTVVDLDGPLDGREIVGDSCPPDGICTQV